MYISFLLLRDRLREPGEGSPSRVVGGARNWVTRACQALFIVSPE